MYIHDLRSWFVEQGREVLIIVGHGNQGYVPAAGSQYLPVAGDWRA